MTCKCPICSIFYRPLSLAEMMLDELASFKYHGIEPRPKTSDGKHYLNIARKLEESPTILKFRAMAEGWDINRLQIELV